MDKRKIIIIAAILLVIVGIISFFTWQANKPIPGSQATEYVDPGSGETVIETDKSAVETDDLFPNMPTFLGFTKFVDYGLSSAQLTDVRFGIYREIQLQDLGWKEISVTVDSIRQLSEMQGSRTVYTFTSDITVDRKDNYKLRIEYPDIDSVAVSITKPNGDVVLETSSEKIRRDEEATH